MSKWNEVHETGNISLLLKKGTATRSRLQLMWLNLQNEYLRKFGISDEYRHYLELKVRHIKASSEYLQRSSKDLEMELRLLDIDIKDMEEKLGESMSADEVYGWLVSKIHSYIPLNQISVDEYQGLIKFNSKNNGSV